MKTFIRQKVDPTPIEDTVFTVVNMAQKAKAEIGADKVVDATIGSLYDEDGKLVAFHSVFTHYNEMADIKKAKYAASFQGNADYREQVYQWVTQGNELQLAHSVIATPGGSGAISTTFVDILDMNETVVIPEIAWGSYKLMASMSNLNVETYSLFEGDHFNIVNFKEVCEKVMNQQGKVLVVINDPCHNPTGYSLSNEEWEKVTEIVNALSVKGPVVLLNDIAYIDFAYDFKGSRNYLTNFNDISDNVMVVVAFSCSKTMTSYGLRCGAAVLLAKKEESVRQLEIVMEKSARAIWSNVPNAAMENFVYVTTEGLEAFNKEKNIYVSLLKERSDIFIKEAAVCGLSHYPYKEGFFVTIKVEDKDRLVAYHEALLKSHIYTVKVNKGIRVALCSLSVEKTKGLAKRMREVLETV